MDLSFIRNIVTAAGPQVSTLLALTAANVLAGIAVALKEKKFEWANLADFYLSDVFPKILGYLAVRIVVELGALEWIGPGVQEAIEGGLLMTAWLAPVVAIGGDLLAKLGKLGIPVLNRVPGIAEKPDGGSADPAGGP